MNNTHIRFWWSQAGSNRRPPECKSGALPAELWPQKVFGLYLKILIKYKFYFFSAPSYLTKY